MLRSPILLPYRGKRPSLGKTVFLAPGVCLAGDIEIGDLSSVWFNVVIRADVDRVRVGKRTNIQDSCTVHVAGGHPALIGDDVTVGHGAVLHACTVEDLCLVGMGAIILDGAVIGEGSLVAAGSLVPPGRRYPGGSLIKGAPAVATRRLGVRELADLRLSARRYVDLAAEYLGPRPPAPRRRT